jgi:PAS domain S-box-containing protein
VKDRDKTKEQLIDELAELRQQVVALEQAESMWRSLVENAPEKITALDRDGTILFVNRTSPERTVEEATGASVYDYLSPDEQEQVRKVLESVSQSGQTEKYEAVVVRADGTRVVYSNSVAPITHEGQVTAVIIIATDITEHKQAEQALEESESKYRTLFETMAQGVVYQSANGRITSANPAAERILGLTLEQMQGRTSRDPRWKAIREDGSDFPGDTHPAMEALKTGKEVRNVVMGVFNPRKEGYVWININAVPQFRSGEEKPYQVYTTFEDITHRKRMEEQLKASLREKEAMLVEIHHRVRNNLQVITSLLDFQAASAQNEQVSELLRESVDRVRSMALIHSQLYQAPDLARIDFADYVKALTANLMDAYRVDPVPVVTLQLDVQDIFLEVREAIPCGLLINELISNALKYAFPATSDWPRGFTGEIGFSFRATDEGEYTLVVSDNGVGLPTDLELSNENTLGMLLTNTLVRQLGGSVEWDDEGGTTCRVVFEA